MDTFKVIVMTLAWTFIVLTAYMIVNTMVFGFIDPELAQIANNTSFVDYNRYVSRTNIIKNGFNVACFILILVPYAYLFVRLLLKREKTSPQVYAPQGGGW